MRKKFIESQKVDDQLTYKGEENTRLNNLTDAVFGIALALLIFNVSDADSFSDLVVFAKSFPAILLSIVLLYLVWKEHVTFTQLFAINGFKLQFLNIIFIALVIFYVYPLRFLTKLLTSMLFKLEIEMKIEGNEIPDLMIFYGSIILCIYFTLFLAYSAVLKENKDLTNYEIYNTKSQRNRMLVMALVPFISVVISIILQNYSLLWSSVLGGCSYGLYPLFISLWRKKDLLNKKKYLENRD